MISLYKIAITPPMNNSITNSIPEQSELLRKPASPFEFLLTYISVYEQQLACTTKVFLAQIPHYEQFQIDFLGYIVGLVLSSPPDIKGLLVVGEILLNFRSRKYYDKVFFKHCNESFLKGASIALELVQEEVLDGNFTNAYILYHFSLDNIDLSAQMAKFIFNASCHRDESHEFGKTVLGQEIKNIILAISKLNQENLEPNGLCILDEASRTPEILVKALGSSEYGISISCSNIRQIIENEKGEPAWSIAFSDQLAAQRESKIKIPNSLLSTKRKLSYSMNDIIDQITTICDQKVKSISADIIFKSAIKICEELAEIGGFDDEIDKLRKYAGAVLERFLSSE